MSKYLSLVAAVAVVVAVSAGAKTVQATTATYSFSVLEDNSALYDLSGQLFFDVTGDLGDNTVVLRFRNEGPLASGIAEIYFDDAAGLIDAPIVIGASQGVVGFSVKENGNANLPGGNTLTPEFNESKLLTADRDPNSGGVDKAINPSEWLEILVNLNVGSDIASILAALDDQTLRIGLHVIGLPDGESESYLNNPTPISLPAGLVLFLSGLVGIGILGRYKAKRWELATG